MRNWAEAEKILENKRAAVREAGGAEKVQRQHGRGKLTARERLGILFDDGRFTEIGSMVTSRAAGFGMEKKHLYGDGVVTALGYIHGKAAVAAAQDFTVNGGTLGEAHAGKICEAMDKALALKVPIIFLNDSGGARIEEGVDSLAGYAGILKRNVQASGVIPQIAAVLGPCAGGACYSPALCDFVFVEEKNSQMYLTGARVLEETTGEKISPEKLGGAAIHASVSGVAHFLCVDERECLLKIRRLLSYLPQNSGEAPPVIPGMRTDRSGLLKELVPANQKLTYDVHKVIEALVDENSFLESQKSYASNIVTGFCRIDGRTTAIVANQSSVMAGALEIHASEKAARFIRFCDAFGIPVLTLVDVPAFLPGSRQEHGGIIRHGAKLLYAYAEATVPMVTLILRKAYGGAYIAMGSKELGADIVLAWPIAEIAVMGAAGAVAVIGKKELDAAPDREQRKRELIREYELEMLDPYTAARRGYVDEIISPEETGEKLAEAFRILKTKQKECVRKKHGNIPL